MEKQTNKLIYPVVFLRLTCGWLFLHEGGSKILEGNWSSKAYLAGSTGLLKPIFQGIVSTDWLLAVTDHLVVLSLLAVGLLLIFGLFEKFAAIAGMVLLLFFYLAYPPIGQDKGMALTEGHYLLVDKNLILFGVLWLVMSVQSGEQVGLDFLRRTRRKSSSGK